MKIMRSTAELYVPKAQYAAMKAQLERENNSLLEDIENVWVELEMADYEGEDSAASFVRKLRAERDMLRSQVNAYKAEQEARAKH